MCVCMTVSDLKPSLTSALSFEACERPLELSSVHPSSVSHSTLSLMIMTISWLYCGNLTFLPDLTERPLRSIQNPVWFRVLST